MKSFKDRLNELNEPSHKEIFAIVLSLLNDGVLINDTKVFDGNIITAILDAYYREYDGRKYDEDDHLVSWKKTEVLFPLEERESGILDELEYIINLGYNIHAFAIDSEYWFDEFPTFNVFSYPIDAHMAIWMEEKGFTTQLDILFADCEGDNDTIADWCFDNIDYCFYGGAFCVSENNIANIEVDLENVPYQMAAEIVRILRKHNLHCSEGFSGMEFFSNDDKVYFHGRRIKY